MIINLKLILILFIVSFSSAIYASEKNMLLRLDRLERMIQNNSQTKVLKKLKQLQQENQQLRSLLEELSYQNDKLKTQIHSLNEDMDRRVLLLEYEIVSTTKQNQSSANITPEQISTTDQSDTPTTPLANNDQQASENQNTAEEINFIEQKAYQAAFNELKAQRYGKAGESFNIFLKQYPSSSYAHLAQYWLAESSYAQRKFKQSINNYSTLISHYPDTHKKAEATLKIAYCHYELGEKNSATGKLKELIKSYPKSTEASQAKRLLKKLK